jgi:hypothetical protein
MRDQPFDLLSYLNHFLGSHALVLESQQIEELLAGVEKEVHSMCIFLEALVSTDLWKNWDINPNPYKPMILMVGSEIDRLAIAHNEPAFHSKKHMMDVCLMLTYLLKQEMSAKENGSLSQTWESSSLEKWQLLLAASAHDLGHPGLINLVPFELEQQSLNFLETLLLEAGHEPLTTKDILDTITPWVLATDHGQYKALLERLSLPSTQHEDCLAMLLVEADLASSVLSIRGKLLTDRLCEEWAEPYPEKSIALRNQVGYLNFLTSLRFLSPHSNEARISSILHNSITQLRSQMP